MSDLIEREAKELHKQAGHKEWDSLGEVMRSRYIRRARKREYEKAGVRL